ncbi:MAG TPA: ABC transporter ATP-binding protein [Conexibacter sp.]|nr:ABC transporter ATP-binding protein [Conexibacter sp.]
MSGSRLKLCDVIKHYATSGEVVRAVDGVSLTVAPGELVALHGPSGSGKSTLLLLAAGLLAPDAGTIHFGDRDVGAIRDGDVDYQRNEIGFISQSFDLLPGVPAVENAAVKLLADRVPLSRARRQAIPWLERVGLGARLDHTPERLSGGERQRVAIARALVNEPRLILADEPTGNLDSRRSQDVLALLRSIGRERQAAVLLVTHDPQAAAFADRALTLRDGRLDDGSRTPAAEQGSIAPQTMRG